MNRNAAILFCVLATTLHVLCPRGMGQLIESPAADADREALGTDSAGAVPPMLGPPGGETPLRVRIEVAVDAQGRGAGWFQSDTSYRPWNYTGPRWEGAGDCNMAPECESAAWFPDRWCWNRNPFCVRYDWDCHGQGYGGDSGIPAGLDCFRHPFCTRRAGPFGPCLSSVNTWFDRNLSGQTTGRALATVSSVGDLVFGSARADGADRYIRAAGAGEYGETWEYSPTCPGAYGVVTIETGWVRMDGCVEVTGESSAAVLGFAQLDTNLTSPIYAILSQAADTTGAHLFDTSFSRFGITVPLPDTIARDQGVYPATHASSSLRRVSRRSDVFSFTERTGALVSAWANRNLSGEPEGRSNADIRGEVFICVRLGEVCPDDIIPRPVGPIGDYDVARVPGIIIADGDTALGCDADFDGNGTLSNDDVFAFLKDFLAGEADFNGDGTTASDDYFAFLSAYFEGCD